MAIGTNSNHQLSSNIGAFNICFWNIHGQTSKLIGDKFRDPEFFNVLRTSHIVGFAELHTESDAILTGFDIIKQKIRKNSHRGPKIAGGLAVFVRDGYSHMVKLVPNNNKDCIWIKIKKEDIGGTKMFTLLLCI